LAQHVGKCLSDNAIDLSNHALLQNDIYTFGFFLTRFCNKTWDLLDLSKCYIRDQGLEIIFRVFSNCNRSNVEIKAVNISSNHLSSSSVERIVNLVYDCKVKQLILYDNDIDYENFDDILFSICATNNRPITVHVEKSKGYISNFYINCKLNTKEISRWKGNMKCNCSMYIWKTNLKASDIIELYHSKVIVCVQSSKSAPNILSSLLGSTGVNHAEYILEARNVLVAFNSDAKKLCHAIKDNFLKEDNFTIGMNQGLIEWKTVDLYHCSVGDDDFHQLVQYLKPDINLYFDTFNISHCNLSRLSINTILEFLKNCIVKNLIISDNFIDNGTLISLLSEEICANSRIHNFVKKIPLLVFNDFNLNTDSFSSYAITKYFINCEIDGTVTVNENNFENTIISYEVFFSNNGMEKNLKLILSLTENTYISVNIVEMNISDKFIEEVLTNLQKKPRNHFSYMLHSHVRFMAYGVKQRGILIEGLNSVSMITTLELVKCELKISELHVLKNLFNRSSKRWDAINLSGCSIGDDGFEILCSQIISKKTEFYIKSLNMSCNHLTSRCIPAITELLKYCVINYLIILQNDIPDHDFSHLLAKKYHSGDNFNNFIYETPLVVIFTIQNTNEKVSNIFFIRHKCDSKTMQSMLQNGEESYKVFLVNKILRQIYMTIAYSRNSVLKVITTKESDAETDIQILITTFKLNFIIQSVDISKCDIDNAKCRKLLDVLFTDKRLWYIKELNLSGNQLTLPFLDDIFQSLRFCVIERLILCENNIPDSKCKEVFFEKCILNCTTQNVVVGSPLVIINNSQFTSMPNSAKYSVTIVMAKFCVEQSFTDLFNDLHEYPIDNYVIFLTQTKIMVNDIQKSLSLVCSNIPSNTKFCIYEANLTDEMVKRIVDNVPRENFIKLILVSRTKFFAYNCNPHLITSHSQLKSHLFLSSLQVINCQLSPDHLQMMFGPSSHWWKLNFIDLSNCHIGDKGFAILSSCLPFKTYTRHIKMLNISDNHPSSSSILAIITLLCHCIIERLLTYGNSIDNYTFHKAVCIKYWTSQTFINFAYDIPLIVSGNCKRDGQILIAVCNTYFIEDKIGKGTLFVPVDGNAVLYQIYCLHKETANNILTFYDESTITIKKFSSFAINKLNSGKFYNIKLFFSRRNSVDLIDASQCNVSDQICSVLCKAFLNKESSLRYVKELDLCFNQLSSDFVSAFVKCLQYCIVDNLIISNNDILESLRDAICNACCLRQSILNSISKTPITITSYTGKAIKYTFVVNYKTIDQFKMLIDSQIGQCDTKSHKFIFCNSLFKNESFIYLDKLLRFSFVTVMVYEDGLNDDKLISNVDRFKSNFKSVEYILSSKTMLLVYAANRDALMGVLTNSLSIVTVSILNCRFVDTDFDLIGSFLSLKLRYLKAISISYCSLSDEGFNYFNGQCFNCKSCLSYIKLLDISHNNVTPTCIRSIITALQVCIIEILNISHNEIDNELVSSIFLTAYYGEVKILNFQVGIPLVIINNLKGQCIRSFSTFIVNAEINSYVIHKISDMSSCSSSICTLFLSNIIVPKRNLSHTFDLFQQLLLKNVSSFTLFGTDLTDDIATEAVKFLFTTFPKSAEYFILSETKLLTNFSSIQPLSNVFTNSVEIPNVSCNVCEEFIEIFNKIVSNDNSLLNNVKEINISSYQLTLSNVKSLVDSMQFCCIEELIIFNNDILNKFTDGVFDAYCAGKRMRNFISGVPLTIYGHTEVDDETIILTNVYFVCFVSEVEKTFENLKFKGKYNLLLFNYHNFTGKSMLLHKILSHIDLNYIIDLKIFEVGLKDEIAMNLLQEIKELDTNTGYMLACSTMLLAYQAHERNIVKAIDSNLRIFTIELKKCIISQAVYDLIWSKLSKYSVYFKNITLSDCYLGNEIFKNICKKLFYNAPMLSYLKKLDISHNNVTSSSINTIITSLKFCIIEKLVISCNDIKDELINAVFLAAYCGEHYLLNFMMGVPLTIINTVKGEGISENLCDIRIFLQNAEINECTVSLISDVSNYKINQYSFFALKNNALINARYVLSQFECLLQVARNFLLVGLDIEDEVAVMMINALNKPNMEYFLISDNEVFTNMSSAQLISKMHIYDPFRSFNIGIELFAMFHKSGCNKDTLLNQVKILDLSSCNLTFSCVKLLVNSLQYCSVENLVVSNADILDSFTDAIFKMHCEGKKLLCSKTGIPLTIAHKEELGNRMVIWANTYFIEFIPNNSIESLLQDLWIQDEIVKSSTSVHQDYVFFKNVQRINILHQFLLQQSFKRLMIYEVDMQDEVAVIILQTLKQSRENVKYVIGSKAALVSCNSPSSQIMKAFKSNLLIRSIELKKFIMHNDQIAYLFSRFLYNITLSECCITDKVLEEFTRVIFVDHKILSYLKKLDISHNYLTTCSVSAIISSLQCCIIETLVISGNQINKGLCDHVFLSAYYNRSSILNFTMGVPIVIIDKEPFVFQRTSTASVFLVNTKLCSCEIDLITNLSEYRISTYALFLAKNNVMVLNLWNILSHFQSLLCVVQKFRLFGTDLMDDVATNIADYLENSQKCTEYFLVSETKSMTNLSSNKQILQVHSGNHVPCDNIANELFGMFCKALYCEGMDQRHLKYLDISSYQLTSPYFKLIVDSLQYYCVERLTVSHSGILEKITDAIIYANCREGKKLCNSIAGFPLKVKVCYGEHSPIYGDVRSEVCALFVDSLNEKVDDMLHLDDYDNLILINCVKASSGKSTLQYLSLLIPKFDVAIYEVNLTNELLQIAIDILQSAPERVQCVLASDLILLAYRAKYSKIITALSSNYAVVSFKVTQCTISDDEFVHIGSILSSNCHNIKNITLLQCCVSDRKYQLFSASLFNGKSVISFLREMDISHNNLSPSSVGAIIISLQSCIIEKLIISDNDINNGLCNSIFLKVYCEKSNILNFKVGIPLTIVNCAEELNKLDDQYTVTAFLINADVGKYFVKVFSAIPVYSDCDFHCIALKSNLLEPVQWNTITQQFNLLQHKLKKCTLFAVDLMDELAIKIATALTRFTNNLEFLLCSQWISACKISPIQLINQLPDTLCTVFPLILTRITPTIKQWELFDVSSYNLNNQNILELQTYFLQSKVTITELNLSNSNLTLASAAVISSLVLYCQVKKLHLIGNRFEEFDFCNGIATMLSYSATKYKHALQVEIIFTNSSALLLYNFHSAISNLNLALASTAKVFHFLMVDCKFDKFNSLFETFSKCSSLSSIHLRNNSLHLTELLNMVLGMLKVKCIIHDSDFIILNANCDSTSYQNDWPTHPLIEMRSSIHMEWLLSHQHGDLNLCINFIIDVKKFKFEAPYMQALKENGILNSLFVTNGCIPNHLAKEITALIKDNNALRYFELRNTCLKDHDLKEILESLKMVTELRHLIMESINNIRTEAATKIECIILSNPKLEHFEITNCKLTESAIEIIAKGMNNVNSLKHVSFIGSNISNSAAEIFALALANQANLEYLDFSNTKLQESGMIHVVSALKAIKLHHFVLNNCKITINAANEIVSNLLTNTSTISHFTMSNCKFQDPSIFYITKALSTLSTLQTLNLWSHCAGDSAPAAYIMESIFRDNIALRDLKLLIGMSNIGMFLRSLKYLSSLECIDIYFQKERYFDHSNIYVIECLPQQMYLELNTDTNYMELVTDSNDLNTELDFLDASSTTNKTAIRVGNLFASALQNKPIKHFTLNNCKYKTMFYALDSLCSLQYLDVRSSSLNYSIVNAIKQNHDLHHINISNCAISETLLHQICESMSILRLLNHLDISRNKLTKKSINLISDVIKKNCLLHYLNISECSDCSNQLFKIFQALKHIKYLSYLNAGHTSISELSSKELNEAFIRNEELVFISLHHCVMNANVFALVAKALVSSTNLRHLDLANNFANDEAVSSIGKVIANNPSLEYFNLSYSIMTTKGLNTITSSLKNNNYLKYINLSNSIIDCPAADDLAAIININTGLEYINLSNCWFQNTGIQWLFHSLRFSPLINYCYLDSNILKLDDAKNSNLFKLRNSVISAKEIKDITDDSTSMDYDTTLSSELDVTDVAKEMASKSGCWTDSYNQNIALFAASVEVGSLKKCGKSLHYFSSLENRITEMLDSITSLYFLQSNFIIKEDIKLFLRDDFEIEYLKVSNFKLSHDECFEILSAFGTSKNLQYLIVKANNLSKKVTDKVSDIMQNNQKLKFVDLSNCGLSYQQLMSHITLALSDISFICYLDLSANHGNELSNNTQSDFARLPLKNNVNLKYINLAYSNFPDNVMSCILLKLSRCTSLKYINLQSCIRSKGVLLPSVIASNNALKYLNVSKCNLQEKDIMRIAKYLRINCSIKYLLLCFNVVTDNAAAEIALTIVESSLKQLSISGCKLEQLGMLHIANALKKIVTLQHLDLSYNVITDEAAVCIASALSNNMSLEYLDMSYCTWSTNGLVIIHKILDLEKFTMLKEVDLTIL